LNRQAERYVREGVDLGLSTLADQVGYCAVARAPLVEHLKAYVMSTERLHGDDTTVPVLHATQALRHCLQRAPARLKKFASISALDAFPGRLR
jgi:hypothetical protein